MKITNIEEFTNILEYSFSSTFENLKKSEKNLIKKQLSIAINEIPEAKEKMYEAAKNEICKGRNCWGEFKGSIQKILFIYNTFSIEEKFEFVSNYISGKLTNGKSIEQNLLFLLLDSLSTENKVKLLSKFKIEKLLEYMSDCNRVAWSDNYKIKTRLLYKKYYSICKKALKNKDAR